MNINSDTKNVSQIRRENMEALFARFQEWLWQRFPDEPERGMKTRFANMCEVTPQYLSHVRNGRKEVGHKLARKMEAGVRKLGHEFDDVVDGWLDNDQGRTGPMSLELEAMVHSLKMCYMQNPVETQRALNELARKILLGYVTKP